MVVEEEGEGGAVRAPPPALAPSFFALDDHHVLRPSWRAHSCSTR